MTAEHLSGDESSALAGARMRRGRGVLILAMVVAVATAGCLDRGDGTTLRPPTRTETTAPPPPVLDTATTTGASLPVDPIPADGPALAVVTPAGVVAPVVEELGATTTIRTPCGNTAAVSGAVPLAGAHVVIDPGHGGDETGSVAPSGLLEKDVNLAVAERARDALEARGLSVVLTRTADYRVTLATRAEIATALRAMAFVSVHHNADPDGPSDAPGTESFFQIESAESKRLAGLVWEEVSSALSAYDVAWVADTDAGAKYRLNSAGGDYYGILRQSAGVPAVLAELAYLTNPPEAELLADPDVQRIEGEALAEAVVRFLTTDDPGTGYTEPYARTTPAGPGGGAAGCVDPPL